MRQNRQAKALRGSLTAAFAVAVALVFHVLAGGAIPGVAGIAIPFALALPITVAVSLRCLSLARLSVSVLVSQALFHALFVFGSTPFAQHSGHGRHGMPATTGVAVPDVAAHVHEGFFGGPLMVLSHLVAAFITVLVLYKGETAFLAIRRAGARAFAAAVRLVEPIAQQPVPVRQPVAVNTQASITPRLCTVSLLTRRGPPIRLSH